MSTITLTENTTYSTLMILDDDVIDLAGYLLTIDSEPGETGISITSPGTAGTVTLSGGYDLSSWSMTAGTVPLVVTIPAGTVLGSVTAGSGTNAYGCTNNYGTITTCTGGSGANAYGCQTNYSGGIITTCLAGTGSNARGCYNNYSGAIITTATGGSGATTACATNWSGGVITTCTGGTNANASGCNNNSGTITNCTGGSGTNAHGCNANLGTGKITTCTGGTNTNASGCNSNYGTITLCTGGSGTGSTTNGCNFNYALVVTAVGGSAGSAAFGIKYNYGYVWNITDTTRLAVDIWYSPTVFVFGAGIVGEIKAPVATIYSFGAMNAGATLPAGATVTTLSTGIGLVFAGSLTGGFQ